MSSDEPDLLAHVTDNDECLHGVDTSQEECARCGRFRLRPGGHHARNVYLDRPGRDTDLALGQAFDPRTAHFLATAVRYYRNHHPLSDEEFAALFGDPPEVPRRVDSG